ncbi:MAG: hypothetical protein OXG44_03815 [Gammaproteobacteria bacterium]|nr:hypothetical protein [Gammaproteobacteria bacterium]
MARLTVFVIDRAPAPTCDRDNNRGGLNATAVVAFEAEFAERARAFLDIRHRSRRDAVAHGTNGYEAEAGNANDFSNGGHHDRALLGRRRDYTHEHACRGTIERVAR